MPPVDPEAKIACPTPQHLQAELDDLQAVLDLGEREDTWEKMERAIIRFAAITRGGGYKHLPLFVEGVGRKGVGLQLAACMLSDKGRLSGVAVDLLQTLAPRLGSHFAPLVSLYLDSLVKLLGRPNKVFLRRAEKCLTTIISHCHLMSILPELRRGLNDDAATCRRGCAIGIELLITHWDKGLFNEKGMVGLEDAVKKMATDKDPEVRATGKKIWTAFSSTWPERLEDFSAPLTPTVRRYLGIAATGAGPSKPKMPAAAKAPALTRSAGPGSSSAPSAAHSKPQPARVAALAYKPIRTAPVKAVPAESGPTNAHAGPSRRHPSPIKPTEAPSSVVASAPSSTASSSLPSSPRRGVGRPPLTAHGRSVSHNVLPQTSSLASSPERAISEANKALGDPSRPGLTTSASCNALPESSTAPPRRFAPPARILRPMPTSEEDAYTETADGYLITPSGATVLRNPQRPQQGERWGGLGKRAMGQAQRRVVTAPGLNDVVVVDIATMVAKTPGLGKRTLSRTIHGGPDAVLEENEDESSTAALGTTSIGSAAAIPLPPSPITHPQPLLDSPAPSVGQPIDQPLVSEQGGEEFPVAATMTHLLLQADASSSGTSSTESETLQTPVEPECQEEANETHDVSKQDGTHVSSDTVTSNGIHVVASPPASAGAAPAPAALASSTSTRSIKPSKASEPAGRKPIHSAAAPPRKPPVPPARTAKPVAIERKAFKPTSRSAQPVSTAPAPRNAKPPVPSARAAAQTSAASTSAASTSAAASKNVAPPAKSLSASSSSTSRAPHHEPPPSGSLAQPRLADRPIDAPRPVPKIGHSLTAPTKASLQRAASATHHAPALSVPKAVPPPPVVAGQKKDRVKLKAPLPSFRPTRGAAFAPKSAVGGPGKPASRSASGSSLAASTRSVSASTQAGQGVAKVKPESVPLPMSPAEKAELPPQAIPLPRSPLTESTTLISSPARTAEAERHMSPSPLDMSAGLRARVRSPQVVSDLLPAGKLVDVPSPVSIRPGLNSLGLPVAPDSISKRSIISHGSTEPPISPNGSEDEDDLSGVTFKEHTGRVRVKVLPDPPLALALPVQTEGELRDLMEFSAPTRTPAKKLLEMEGKMGTPGLLGTPRMALMARDANALTPGVEVE